MAYSDFTLDKAVRQLGVKVIERRNIFTDVKDGEVSAYLKTGMERYSAMSTISEKARSERYIAPILDDVFSQIVEVFTIFSGENFDVDKGLKLNGVADFLICICTTKILIQVPIIAVAESKRNTPEDGLGQCIAELYAAALFNKSDNNSNIQKLFGITTNGNEWMFGEYIVNEKLFIYDPHKYTIENLPRIIGILSFMRDEALRMYDNKVN